MKSNGENSGKELPQNGVSNEASENGLLNNGNLSGEKLFDEVGKFIVGNLTEPEDGAEQSDVFNSLENSVVLAALKRTKGNKQAAANLLGLYRPRLYGMIKRHNLEGKV